MCTGSWDKRQNPDPDHGQSFWGWHAGYSSGVCQKLWKVTVHTHLCEYDINNLMEKVMFSECTWFSETEVNHFLMWLLFKGDTSGDYKKLLLKLCGGSDWKGNNVHDITEMLSSLYIIYPPHLCALYTNLHALPVLSLLCLPCLKTSIMLLCLHKRSSLIFCWIFAFNIDGH